MPSPTAVLFDVDGTLLDDMGPLTELGVSCILRSFGADPGIARPVAYRRFLETSGIPFLKQLEQIVPGDAYASQRAACAAAYAQEKREAIYRDARTFPDVPAALAALIARGLPLYVSSGGEREPLEAVLAREGIRSPFTAVFGREDGSKADHIARVRSRHGDVLAFVGDCPSEMRFSAEYGLITIGRADRGPGTFSASELRAAGATYVVEDLSALPALLGA